MKLSKQKLLELFFILLVGLTPLLWFHGKEVILGHDSGLTLSPLSHFLDRLSPWTERFAFGSDQTYAMPGFFIHGLDAFVSLFGFDLQTIQKITFILWFVLPGLTMFVFASWLEERLGLKYFVLPVTVLYMFNHFLLQGWFIAERTKFSLYAALPLLLFFLFRWYYENKSTLITAIAIAITFFFLNGEASIPLFGGVIITSVVFILFYFYEGINLKKIKKLFTLLFLTFSFSLFLNAYWFFPYGYYVLHFYSKQVTQAGGLDGILGWLSYLSQDSSLINLLRLQGIPEWYENPLHPYSSVFLNNPFMVLVSYLLPVAAFGSFVLTKENKQKKLLLFFGILAVISVVFIAGAHDPFGSLYILMVKFVPGFIAFRSPFYKFSPAIWIAYSVLIGFTVAKITELFSSWKVSRFLPVFVSVLIILYSFPFLTGSFFNYMVGERSMKVIVPQYIYDFRDWSESKERINTRTLVLPGPNFDGKVEAYTWGYWSLAPLTSLLTNAPVVNDTMYMSGGESSLVELLYTKMKHNEPGWENLATLLNIHSFLLRNDFDWKSKGSPTDPPSLYKQALSNSDVHLVKKFGAWEVYDLDGNKGPSVSVANSLSYLSGNVADIATITDLPNFSTTEPIYVSVTKSTVSPEVLKNHIGNTYLVGQCITCDLQHAYINTDLYTPLLTKGSIFYSLINAVSKKKAADIKSQTYSSLSDILGFEKVVAENKSPDILQLNLDKYKGKLETLIQAHKNIAAIEDNATLLDESEVLRTEEIVVLRVSSDPNLTDNDVLRNLQDTYNKLHLYKQWIDANVWRTTSETEKKFSVTAIQDGIYTLFYKPNDQATKAGDSITYEIDGKSVTSSASPTSTSWYKLSQVALTTGIHKVKLFQDLSNLYKGPSQIVVSNVATLPCVYTDNFTGRKGDTFRISFEHYRQEGQEKFFVEPIEGSQPINLLDSKGEILNSIASKTLYTRDYQLEQDGSLSVALCSKPKPEGITLPSSIIVDTISIRKIVIPNIVFVKTKSDSASTFSFKHDSQTKYELAIHNGNNTPQIVMLNESFNPIWRINNNVGTVMLNGYANGWIVKGNGKYLIEYWVNRLVTIGFVVSAVSFAGLLVVLFLKKLRS